MVSTYRMKGCPKYVWSVDQDGEPYEANWGTTDEAITVIDWVWTTGHCVKR